jgi:hypothetical protein
MHVDRSCPQCRGRGWVPYQGPMGCSDARTECWVCNGSGEFVDPRKAKREKSARELFRAGKQEMAIDEWLSINNLDLKDQGLRQLALGDLEIQLLGYEKRK